ncbi:hypothetical protein MATL_G00126730 [Megalops atlanticus]|uniref:Ig-like domain-containing protein n=1 Tax=Megalops atlanticus TaxID=7932 RepID=A0A9D3PWZ2_MEGAT|nr:hypothetical protein MATL_G00126730 [Megalops atlanticus]
MSYEVKIHTGKFGCPFLLLLLCILSTVATLEPHTVLVKVGSTATLPCSGPGGSTDLVRVYWKIDSRPVFSYVRGLSEWGPGFEERVEIPRENISMGHFSLIIRQTNFRDVAEYRCFCIESSKLKFCSVVHLNISGYEDRLVLMEGKDLLISLYTHEAVTVHYGDSTLVCGLERNRVKSPGPRYKGRLQLNNDKLMLQAVTLADLGRYTVRDRHGNVINLVMLIVNLQGSVLNSIKPEYLLVILVFAAVLFCFCAICLFLKGFKG